MVIASDQRERGNLSFFLMIMGLLRSARNDENWETYKY